jgi:hypothetical protein
MKFRIHPPPPADGEHEQEERLRAMLHRRGLTAPTKLPDEMRAAMLVKTNDRIDRATSGRALSLSWALRVAVPGVVAIVAFFIGVHYYTTPAQPDPAGLTPVLSAFSDTALDSLMEVHAVVDTSAIAGDTQGGLFDIPADQAAEYLLATDRIDVVAETFEEKDLEAVLTVLAANHTTSF